MHADALNRAADPESSATQAYANNAIIRPGSDQGNYFK
jgi:hypothetical protein